MAIPAKGSIYRSGDAKKLADKMEAERQAERSRFSVQGGQFGGSGLYVSPYGNYLDPALEAQVARSRGNNVRPSPATVNMAPVAKPVAPKSPGRGLTYAEAYGPGSTVVADRVAEEKRIARERAAMQKAIGKISAAKGRYASPRGWPAIPQTPSPAAGAVPQSILVPPPVGDIEVAGGPGPVAMNPQSQYIAPPRPVAQPSPVQPPRGWPQSPSPSPASMPAANRPGMAYYQDPNTGVVYEVAAGSTSQNTGIGPLGAMRNAYADIVGNSRPVSGTTEVSPSMQVSPQRGQMNAPASEQMMREGGYLPVDRAALDAARDKYRKRKMTNAQKEAERRRALLEAEMTQGLYGVAPVIR